MPPPMIGLARRNALVLAVAQALAGGNNTVIVATAGIVGSVIAPDKSPGDAADLGDDLRHVDGDAAGRLARAALRPPVLAASRLAVRHGGGPHLLHRGAARLVSNSSCSARSAAGSTLRRTSHIASPPRIPRAKASARRQSPGCSPAACSSGVIGPQIVIFTKDLWPPYLFAATYIAQACVAGLAGLVLMLLRIPRPHAAACGERRPSAWRDRPHAAVRGGSGLRGRKLRDDEPGDDLGTARHGRVRPFGHRRDASASNGTW